jgi:predicted O-methyltransferase YrrM
MLRRIVNRLTEPLLRGLLKSKSFSVRDFGRYEDCGVHILPLHYYSPIPRSRELNAAKPQWNRAQAFAGMDFRLAEQIKLLPALREFAAECRVEHPYDQVAAKGYGPGYGEVESACLYAMIRSLRPRRIIEVGSGVSTYYECTALRKNGQPAEIVCVEPYPSEQLKWLSANTLTPTVRIVEQPVEQLEPSFFGGLAERDLLFIDSTHTVRINGDVPFLYLDVLPTLQRGVRVHIHDIVFPYPSVPDDHPFFDYFHLWRETDLLHAFLIGNREYAITLCQSYLHYKAREELKKAFGEYPADDIPSSIWLERV